MSATSLFASLDRQSPPATGRRLIAGIDPDLKGAIIILSDSNDPPVKFLMPTYQLPKKKKGKTGKQLFWTLYDEEKIKAILLNDGNPVDHVFIEKPLVGRESDPLRCPRCETIVDMRTPMPPLSMAVKFEGVGLIRGICVGLGIKVQMIHPRTWQARMLDGAPGTLTTKGRSQYNARRLFPSFDLRQNERCKVSYQGICDAILIAEFGRRNLGLDLCVEDEELGW